MLPNNLPNKIIFDFDGTLVDTSAAIYKAFNLTLKHYDIEEWSLFDLQNKIKFSPRDYFPILLGEQRAKEGGKLFLDFYNHIKGEIKPIEHAIELLEYCFNAGIKLYIISNKRGYILRDEVINILNWQHFFKEIVGSEDFTHDKPHPAIVEFTIGTKGTRSVWFIGDSDVDITCGALADCYSILVNREIDDNFEHKPDYITKNITSLLTQLKAIQC